MTDNNDRGSETEPYFDSDQENEYEQINQRNAL